MKARDVIAALEEMGHTNVVVGFNVVYQSVWFTSDQYPDRRKDKGKYPGRGLGRNIEDAMIIARKNYDLRCLEEGGQPNAHQLNP